MSEEPQQARSKPLLSVIGLGVQIPDHTTMQAMKAMASCSQIYSIVQEPSSLWLPPNLPRPIPVTNILEMYAEGVLRTQNYDRVADMILQRVTEGQTIGYVTYGNPLAYDSVAQKLVRTSQEAEISFQVVPGISSVDTLLCDLGVDMAPGIQVYEASWLVAAEIRLEVRIAAILLQIGTFGSLRSHYRSRPDARSLTDLVEYLGLSYPSSQVVFLVRSSGGTAHRSNIRKTPLGGLSSVAADDLLNCSLYIPPFEPTRLKEDLLASMQEA